MDTLVLGLRVLLALACVIGLIWVLARRAGWGKGRRRPAGPAVEVVGRQALGRHAGVAVIAVGNRRLLLGYGEQNVTMLTELAPAPAETLAPLTVADEGTGSTPMTLGALAAAVLPTPRGPRTPKAARAARAARAGAPAAVAGTGDAFADALAVAELAVPTVPAAGTVPTVPATPVAAASAASATAATAAASASAVAALAAAAAIPVEPARPQAADLTVERVAVPVPTTEAPGTEAPGALHGSVLAPSTWKQAVAALRERTVRR